MYMETPVEMEAVAFRQCGWATRGMENGLNRCWAQMGDSQNLTLR